MVAAFGVLDTGTGHADADLYPTRRANRRSNRSAKGQPAASRGALR